MPQILSYSLSFIKKKHLSSILKICEEQLGNGFLDPDLLASYLDHPSKYCQVVLLDQQVIGFSLMEISPRALIAQKMKQAEQWFLDYFLAYDNIGYRSLTAVSKEFEGKGVASFLVKQGLDFLSGKVDVVVCDAWKSEHTHIGSILERNGCQALKEVPHFWTTESVEQNYQCGFCGAPPCECSAVIYARFFDNNLNKLASIKKKNYWWERKDLNYTQNYLTFAASNLHDFVQNKPTPFYVYNIQRILDKYTQLSTALEQYTPDYKVYYAMKANRHAAILSHLKAKTNIGIDVCSPNELDRAIQYGFQEKEITYTGTSLSQQDLKTLVKHPNIQINFDAISSIRRFIQLNSNQTREIGIRINPNIGMAYRQDLEYSGNEIVKFGIYQEQWAALKTLINHSNIIITRVHCHSGSGFLTHQLERLPSIFEVIDNFITLFPTVKTLNLGGGLGVPQNQGDQILDLKEWAAIICTYANRKGLKLAFEPGDYLVKDAGLLITQVNTIEEKKGKYFVGIDTGMNMNYEYAYYKMNLEAVPLLEPKDEQTFKATLSGNINEPIDLFSEDKLLPLIEEGDYLALLNSGGYGASTSSNHCMRGDFKEYVICE
jgi:diaminopimelate decarboxylase